MNPSTVTPETGEHTSDLQELRQVHLTDPKRGVELAQALIQRLKDSNKPHLLDEVYLLKGRLHNILEQYDDAIESSRNSLAISRQNSNRLIEALALNNIGLSNMYLGKATEAISYLEEALVVKKELSDKTIQRTLINLGLAYSKISDYQRAVNLFFEALKLAENERDVEHMAMAYSNIALVHSQQGDYEYALSLFHITMDLVKNGPDKTAVINTAINMGAMLVYLTRYTEAEEYYHKGLALSESCGYKTGLFMNNMNLGELLMKQNNYKDALPYLLKSYQIAKEMGNRPHMLSAVLLIGELNMFENNEVEAEYFLLQALQLSKETNDLVKQQESHLLLSRLFETQKILDTALEHFKQYDAIKGQILNVENSKVINELKTKYEVEKKEKENEISRLRNIELKNTLDELTTEKQRSEKLLLNILPGEIADELKKSGSVEAKLYDSVSVMFADIQNFTRHSEHLSPAGLVGLLDFYFHHFDEIIEQCKVEKIKTMGDSYLCVCGMPKLNANHAGELTKAAVEIRNWLQKENELRRQQDKMFFDFRFGIHSGPLVAGIVGKTKFEYDIWGDTVNTAARLEQCGVPGKINISAATYALVKDKFTCTPRGKIEAKNKGLIEMYFVEG